MGIDYSVDVDPDRTAKAMLRDRQMSHKHSIELARELKGKTVAEARSYLQAVIDGDQAVPFRRFNSGTGHRANLEGWDAGRYPTKVSEAMLDLLENASNNAENQGFDPDAMVITHCAAHKVGEVRGIRPRAMGRATEWNTPEVDVELVIEEVTEDDG
ncbi:MAG: 50S ribosomal protein L22 [Halobacteriota archaeon]